MLKRWMALTLALLCLSSAALAEVYEGTTAALDTVTVRAETAGVVKSLPVQVGQRVDEGEALVRLKSEKTFASQDGDVSLVSAEVGDDVSGEILELAPTERYTIHCTVDKAYKSPATKLVHSGETVYVKCTHDGTRVSVDGRVYRVDDSGAMTPMEGDGYAEAMADAAAGAA